MSKVIAVIGATGAQGLPTVKHLLAPSEDGSPSPWKVRALTRNPDHWRAKELKSLGAEIVQGSFLDSSIIHELFEGAYGAFVNTDGFTVGETAEMIAGITIWEIARLHKLRHFVWSNLDYAMRLGNYDPMYAVEHYNGKGRVADFLTAQDNAIDDPNGTMWTVFTNGPYLDIVWVSPIGDKGTLPLIALDDLGWWSRYIFDNAPATTGKNIEIASHMATYPEIVETFKSVTGLPAEYKALSMDEYFALWNGEIPLACNVANGTTWNKNFRAFFAMWRDNIVKRDMEWIASVHPPITLAKWMRDNKYEGAANLGLLKVLEDDAMHLRPNMEKCSQL